MSRLKLGLLLWLAGLAGVIAYAATLPELIERTIPDGQTLPLPISVLAVVSGFQTAVLLALAVWLGVALAPKVNLHAPAFGFLAARRRPEGFGRMLLFPGVIGAFLGWLLFLLSDAAAPAAHEGGDPSLAVRLLYGGITEELLLRWGFMTLLLWLAWRFLQRRHGAPRSGYVMLAIVVSAVAFGVGHLPFASLQAGGLTAEITWYVIGFNTAFGVLFGYLFARHGLESAMIAHGGAHALHYLAQL